MFEFRRTQIKFAPFPIAVLVLTRTKMAGMLRVNVAEITNFKLMDSGRSSDPYCKITTGGD